MLAVPLRRIGALIACVVLAQPLAAQDHETTARGTGRLTMRGLADVQITRAKVKLEEKGDFEIELFGARPFEKWSVEGTYVGDGWARRVELRVTRGLTKDAAGTGTVTFDGNNAIEQINVQGSNTERAFQLDFRGDGSGGAARPEPRPNDRNDRDRNDVDDRDDFRGDDRDRFRDDDRNRAPVNFSNFDRTLDGRGTLRTRFGDDPLTRLRVRLQNDGTATIRAEGIRQATTFRARWRPAGNARVEFDVLEMNGRRVDGDGLLLARGRDFERVELDIRNSADGRVDLRFRTDGRFDDDFGFGNGQVPASYNRSHTVRGTIDLPGLGRVQVTRVQARLERNGDARLRLQTDLRGRDRNVEIVGAWQENRNGAAELRWVRIDDIVVSGAGLMTFFNGRDLDRIRGLARSRDGRIAVDLQIVR